MYVYVYTGIWRYVIHVLFMHACVCMQIYTVKIVSVDRVLTLNVAHQTTEPSSLRLMHVKQI